MVWLNLGHSELAFSIFNTRIFDNQQIVDRLRADIESWVNWERSLRYFMWFVPFFCWRRSRLKHDERDLIPLLIKQLLIYHKYNLFEDRYVEVTRKFYEEESERLSKTMKDDAPDFFRNMRLRLEEEVKRAMILPISSWSLVRKVTEVALWTNRIDWLANESKYPLSVVGVN